jgi:hypothetical protein
MLTFQRNNYIQLADKETWKAEKATCLDYYILDSGTGTSSIVLPMCCSRCVEAVPDDVLRKFQGSGR